MPSRTAEPTAKDLRLAREHPAFYARLASEGEWVLAPHLRLIADEFLRCYRGEIKRLIVSCPPRSGKTMFLSRFATAWWLGNRPRDRVIMTTYQERLARRWSRQAKDDLAHWGPKVWGVQSSTRASTAEWDIFGPDGRRLGGGMKAVGAGGALTGSGANALVVDDVIKNTAEGNNPAMTEKIYQWFREDVITRLEPGGVAILLNTRWSTHDLIGRLLEDQERGEGGEPWVHVNLPALAEEGDALGRAPGEPLWPKRFDARALAIKRREVGEHGFAALYQGRPVPLGGGMFRREWLRYYERLPEGRYRLPDRPHAIYENELTRFITADLAVSTTSRADYSVFAVWGWSAQHRALLLLDLVRARLEGPAIVPKLRDLCSTWKCAAIYMEKNGFQLSLVQQAAQAGLPVRELVADKNKEARALPATAALEQGGVLLPRDAHWLADFESELLQFPAARHDDQVDVLAYAVLVANDLQSSASRAVYEFEEPWGVDRGGGWWNGSAGGW